MSAENAPPSDRFEAMRRGLSNAWDTIERQQRTIEDLRGRIERLEAVAFENGDLEGEPVTSDAEDTVKSTMEAVGPSPTTRGVDDGG